VFVSKYSHHWITQTTTGIDWHPLQTNAPSAADVLEKVLIDFAPDVIVIAGWMIESYRELVVRKTMMNSAMIVVMDAQWKGQLRQYGARTFLASYLSRFSLIVVPGERSRQYARRLGFSENRYWALTVRSCKPPIKHASPVDGRGHFFLLAATLMKKQLTF
jgi:hypothetical protein